MTNASSSTESGPASGEAPGPPFTRVPHMGHALLFFVLTFLAFVLAEGLVLGSAQLVHREALSALTDPILQLIATAMTYLLTLPAASFVYPLVWHRSFAAGVSWHGGTARRLWMGLAAAGLAIGFSLQVLESFIKLPKDLPVEQYFRTPQSIWAVTFFGTLLAPLFEELLFRGLLLPAIASAIDYLRLPKEVEAHREWQARSNWSTPALLLSAAITSALFALIHAPQLGFAWPVVALLACVSLVLCYVRIRFDSVAASTLVHAAYNFSVFLTLFIVTGGYRHLERAH